jgi:hypothetical protein
MSKRSESEADRVWKDKLDQCVSQEEAVILICVAIALAGIVFVASIASAAVVI